MGESSTRRLTCLVCPIGCELRATVRGQEIVSLEGHECPRGEAYASQELFDPRRVLTTTVRLCSSEVPRLPVKTSEAVPRERLRAGVQAARELRIEPPVRRGDVLMRDVAGTGADLVATRSVGDNGGASSESPKSRRTPRSENHAQAS